MKERLKTISFVRENYRRLRKIFLHLIHGRLYQAALIANHYNPIHRLLLLTPYRFSRGQRKNYRKSLKRVFKYKNTPAKDINVGLIVQDGDFSPKSSAFIRLIAPLTHPSVSKKINIRLMSPRKVKVAPDIDVYIVQRTAFKNLKQAKAFWQKAKANNAAIVVDTDDAFSVISESHPEYKKQTRLLEAKEFIVEKADEIWLSEDDLITPKYADKSFVMRNTLDARIWKSAESKPKKKVADKKIRMLYMGTATHGEDFKMILPALDKLDDKYPGAFQLTTMGVSQDLPKRKWIKQLNAPRFGSLYPNFVKWFLKQGPFDIGLSPLVDSPFNRAKSDIKCLDYLAAGILPVVSDLEPYQSPEIKDFIIKVKNDANSWESALAEIITNPENFRKEKAAIMPKAQKYIWQKRSAAKTGKVLLKHLEKLAKQ